MHPFMSHDKVVPLQVEVTNHPEPKKWERRAAYQSKVLTASTPFDQVCGYDPLRECVRFSGGNANPYVISGSKSQASDVNNLAAVIATPNGRYVPANAAYETTAEGQNDIWVSAGVYPTIIGYEIIRKVPE